jgi:hypothetical protein
LIPSLSPAFGVQGPSEIDMTKKLVLDCTWEPCTPRRLFFDFRYA